MELIGVVICIFDGIIIGRFLLSILSTLKDSFMTRLLKLSSVIIGIAYALYALNIFFWADVDLTYGMIIVFLPIAVFCFDCILSYLLGSKHK